MSGPKFFEVTDLDLDQIEKQALQAAFKLCDGNLTKAALYLNRSRTTVYRLAFKYGIDFEGPRIVAAAEAGEKKKELAKHLQHLHTMNVGLATGRKQNRL